MSKKSNVRSMPRYRIDRDFVIDEDSKVAVHSSLGPQAFFAKKTSKIRDRAQEIVDSIAERNRELKLLQEKCKHRNATYEYKSSTGGWDSGSDRYWCDCKCYDCFKTWKVDQ
jgi:hypothetical protein